MSGGCRALRRGLWPRSFSTALEPAPARKYTHTPAQSFRA